MQHSPFYTTVSIDRAHALRRDSDRLSELLNGPGCRILPVWRNCHAVDANVRTLFLGDHGDMHLVFLGLLNDEAWFAADLSDLEEPPALGGEWRDLREFGTAAPADEAAMMLTARGLLGWHRRHGFCGVCGKPTESRDAGHMRLCTNEACGTSHFPRNDPAVIMLIRDAEDRALMGQHSRLANNVVSTLAGFVEHGESLEQAVCREIFEETSVVVRPQNVTYIASQPWPFPSSLMLGFTGVADSTAIEIDPDELTGAFWFTRDEVRSFREWDEPGDGFALPRRDSISRTLIDGWLNGG